MKWIPELSFGNVTDVLPLLSPSDVATAVLPSYTVTSPAVVPSLPTLTFESTVIERVPHTNQLETLALTRDEIFSTDCASDTATPSEKPSLLAVTCTLSSVPMSS